MVRGLESPSYLVMLIAIAVLRQKQASLPRSSACPQVGPSEFSPDTQKREFVDTFKNNFDTKVTA